MSVVINDKCHLNRLLLNRVPKGNLFINLEFCDSESSNKVDAGLYLNMSDYSLLLSILNHSF